MSITGSSCDSNQFALCLSSFSVGIASDCAVTVTPLQASGNYVTGIWSSNASGMYKRLVACPTSAQAAVANAGSASQIKAAVQTALEQHIYGSTYVQSLSSVDWSATGAVTLNTAAGSCALKYAITAVRGGAGAGWNAQVGCMALGLARSACCLTCRSGCCHAGQPLRQQLLDTD